MRLRLFFLTALICAACSAVSASAPVDVRQYLSLRKKLATSLPLQTLRANPSEYIGKVFEIRGRVSGLIRSDSGVNMSIGSLVIATDTSPEENPGTELACLVKIGPGSVYALTDLQLVACTYEVDLKRLEERWSEAEKAKAEKARIAKEKAAKAASAKQATKAGTQTIITENELIRIYKNAVKSFNRKLTDSQADTIARSILGFSAKYQVDPRLVVAVVLAESRFKVGATSPAGAQGLGQLMPGTAAGLGVNNAYDPVENIYGSVRYIRSMLDRVTGKQDWNNMTWYDLSLALAAYNAGPGAVKKHGGIPPYRETQNYVKKVTSIYKKLCGG